MSRILYTLLAKWKTYSLKVSYSHKHTGAGPHVCTAFCVGVKRCNGVPKEKQWPCCTYGINHAWLCYCIWMLVCTWQMFEVVRYKIHTLVDVDVCACGLASRRWSWAHAVPKEALITQGLDEWLGGGCGGLPGYGPLQVRPCPALVYPWWEQPGEYMGSWSGSAMVHTLDKTSDSIIRLHLWPWALWKEVKTVS